MIALIAAVARNGVIGAGGKLPWRLSSDLKRFRALTMGHAMIMGRKTFDSIGSPLPGRRSLVLTRDPAFARDGVDVVHDVAEALAWARGEAVVIGGAEIYAQTIALAGRLHITEIDLTPEGDAQFPDIDPALWRETRREPGVRGPRDDADFFFVDYERRLTN